MVKDYQVSNAECKYEKTIRRELATRKNDLNKLKNLPRGSLGKVYADNLIRQGLLQMSF